jgi:hypothetical protein
LKTAKVPSFFCYKSTLLTSLTKIALSTTGCSWRPAAVMITTWPESHSFPGMFNGRRERIGADYFPPHTRPPDFQVQLLDNTFVKPGLDASNIGSVYVQQKNLGMGYSPVTPINTRELSPFIREDFNMIMLSTS